MNRQIMRVPMAAGLLLVASLNAAELDIPFHRQNTPVWCWAAVSAMVIGFVQKFEVQDCEVLSEYDIRLGGRGLCCQGAPECQRAALGLQEIGTVLGGIFATHGRYDYTPLSYDDVVGEIDADHPVVAALTNPATGSGHVVVISGYRSGQTLVVLDPLHGRSVVPYQTLRANWQYGIWTGTLRITTDPAEDGNPGCHRVQERVGPYVRTRAVCAPQ